MTCPRCQHENSARAKFCEECGAALSRTCVACGAQISSTAKFCPECAVLSGQSTDTSLSMGGADGIAFAGIERSDSEGAASLYFTVSGHLVNLP